MRPFSRLPQLILVGLVFAVALADARGAAPVVELVTVGPDHAIETRFGHILLRIIDTESGVDDVCEGCQPATISNSEPFNGTLDARRPHSSSTTLPREGIGSPGLLGSTEEPILILLTPRIAGAEDCFTLCETAPDPLLHPEGSKSLV